MLQKNQAGIIWIKVLKDIFPFDEDVYICTTYIPPAGSKVLNSRDIDIFEELELDVTRYKQLGKVFLTGDFNSRTSVESDCLDFDRYLDDEDIFLNDILLQPRVNSDHVIDAHGRRLLLLCQTSDLLIANGRLHDDCSIGEHTFSSLNGMSTVDYLLSNPLDMQCLSNFKILEFNEFSDHAPVYFSLPHNGYTLQKQKQKARAELKIIYDESKATIFRSELMNINEDLQRLTDCVNSRSVDSVVNLFTHLMYTTTATVYGQEIQVNETFKSKYKQNKWFDQTCSEAKTEFKRARNTFLRNKNTVNRQTFVSARTKFNRIKRTAKRNFKIKEGQNICNMAKKQPRKFWKEDYLDFILEKKYRIAFTKFRLSSHDLAIERGRFENIERNDRLCRHCNLNMIESEYHFMLVCPLYRDLRNKYLKKYYCHWPTLNKFDDLMTTKSTNVIKNVSKFVYFAMKLRNT